MKKLRIFSMVVFVIAAASFGYFKYEQINSKDNQAPVITMDTDSIQVSCQAEDEETDLGDVLINHASTEKIIRNWNNSGLYMILNKTSSNAIETLLKSMTLKQIIAFCREKMDYVVIDTSPLALVADTEELAQMTDASVLVVRQDTVLTKDINDAIDILNNTRGKVLGCILNGVTSQNMAGSGHYGYGGHYGKRA